MLSITREQMMSHIEPRLARAHTAHNRCHGVRTTRDIHVRPQPCAYGDCPRAASDTATLPARNPSSEMRDPKAKQDQRLVLGASDKSKRQVASRPSWLSSRCAKSFIESWYVHTHTQGELAVSVCSGRAVSQQAGMLAAVSPAVVRS